METFRQLKPQELWSCSSTPSARRRRLKLKKGQGSPESCGGSDREGTASRGKTLTPPAIEVTPSSEDEVWSNCSTPSASPKRRRGLLKKWLSRREGGGCSGSITPRSTPSNSPATRKRLTGNEAENMVEKGSENSYEKTPSAQTPTSPPPGAVPTTLQSNAQLPNSQPGTPLPSQLSGRASIWNSKKIQSFYSMLSPNYKQRNEDFRKIFKKLPDSERLIVDYSCALQRDILLQGRLYLSENWICFHSNIFRWETTITIQLKDIRCVKKEKTAKVIPNAIQVCTETEKHFFTSFGARDRSFLLIFRLWQNALLDKTLSPQELWHTVHQCYGTELGLTSEDEDYVSPRELLNGLGVSEEYPECPDLSDTSTRSDNKLSTSPKLPATDSFASLAGSAEGLLATVEDMTGQSDALSDSQVDGSSSQTVTPLSEMAGSGLLDSLPALDLLPGEDLPTDPSNNSTPSSTQDEEGIGLGKDALTSDLSGRLHINAVYHISADRLQQALTYDTRFMSDFMEQRNFTDIVVNPWAPDSSGKQSRVINYIIPINNPLGPKSAPAVETQTLTYSLKGSFCILDTQVVTQGIPYQDYFYTSHRYCITSVTKNKARLRVSSEIVYRKQPWSLVRGIIEKNSWSGMEDHFRQLADAVVKLEQSCVEELGVREKPVLRRRKRTLSWKNHHVDTLNTVAPPLDNVRVNRHSRISGSISSQLSHLSDRGTSQSIPTALFIISIVLLVLVVLNMMLFYRLWSLEHTARTFQTWQSYAVSKGRFPQTSADWAEILELQKRFHSAEVQKWKQTLRTSVQLLDEMRSSLQRLQQGVLVNDAATTAPTQEEDALS
ncbi:protein Aster-A isoform X1 [Eleutherodactylus coqui]